MGIAITIIGGVLCLIGFIISMRGYWRSRNTDKLEFGSYIIGLVFILAGVGLFRLSESLQGM